ADADPPLRRSHRGPAHPRRQARGRRPAGCAGRPPGRLGGGGEPRAALALVEALRLLLEFPFMRNALLAGTIVAVVAGVLGWFVVLRGETFPAHTLSVAGFPGAAGAVLAGVTPLAGLVLFCV